LPNPFHYYHTQVHYSWPLIPFGDKLGRKGSKGIPEQQGVLLVDINQPTSS